MVYKITHLGWASTCARHRGAARNWAIDGTRGSVLHGPAKRLRVPAAGKTVAIGVDAKPVTFRPAAGQKITLRIICRGIGRAIALEPRMTGQKRPAVQFLPFGIGRVQRIFHDIGSGGCGTDRQGLRRNLFLGRNRGPTALCIAFDGFTSCDSVEILFVGNPRIGRDLRHKTGLHGRRKRRACPALADTCRSKIAGSYHTANRADRGGLNGRWRRERIDPPCQCRLAAGAVGIEIRQVIKTDAARAVELLRCAGGQNKRTRQDQDTRFHPLHTHIT